MKRVSLLVVLLVAGSAGRSSAQTVITACLKVENGQARFVASNASCLPSETRVQWNVVGPAGPAGPKGDQGPQGEPGPGGPFRLLDVNDRLVGVVLTSSTYYPASLKVLRTIDTGWVAFDVTYAGYSGGTYVYYSDTSCTSADRYMSLGSQADFFRYGAVMTESTGQRFLVYPGDQAAPAGIVLRSYRRSGMTVGSCTTLTSPISGSGLANYRAVEPQLLDLEFPFKLAQ